jgi:hypothetical protein
LFSECFCARAQSAVRVVPEERRNEGDESRGALRDVHPELIAPPAFTDYEADRKLGPRVKNLRSVDDLDLERRIDRRAAYSGPLEDSRLGGGVPRFEFTSGHRWRTGAERVDLDLECACRYWSAGLGLCGADRDEDACDPDQCAVKFHCPAPFPQHSSSEQNPRISDSKE